MAAAAEGQAPIVNSVRPALTGVAECDSSTALRLFASIFHREADEALLREIELRRDELEIVLGGNPLAGLDLSGTARAAEGQAPSRARPALTGVAEGQAPSKARPALTGVEPGGRKQAL